MFHKVRQGACKREKIVEGQWKKNSLLENFWKIDGHIKKWRRDLLLNLKWHYQHPHQIQKRPTRLNQR